MTASCAFVSFFGNMTLYVTRKLPLSEGKLCTGIPSPSMTRVWNGRVMPPAPSSTCGGVVVGRRQAWQALKEFEGSRAWRFSRHLTVVKMGDCLLEADERFLERYVLPIGAHTGQSPSRCECSLKHYSKAYANSSMIIISRNLFDT